jgi:hypothetical protein
LYAPFDLFGLASAIDLGEYSRCAIVIEQGPGRSGINLKTGANGIFGVIFALV